MKIAFLICFAASGVMFSHITSAIDALFLGYLNQEKTKGVFDDREHKINLQLEEDLR